MWKLLNPAADDVDQRADRQGSHVVPSEAFLRNGYLRTTCHVYPLFRFDPARSRSPAVSSGQVRLACRGGVASGWLPATQFSQPVHAT